MNYKYIRRSYLVGWFIASIIWFLIRVTITEQGEPGTIFRLYFFLFNWLSQGLLYGLLFFLIIKYLTKRVKYYQLLAISVLTQLAVAVSITIIVYLFVKDSNIEDLPTNYRAFISAPFISHGIIFSLIVNTFISITLSVNLILGKGTLNSILTGKYYYPVQENRIFMFIDLQNSTNIAEQLGHREFSRFIQDCIYEMAVFNKYKGVIYKYVGDEAIITWTLKDGVTRLNCIAAYFEYTQILKQKMDFFEEKYGIVPMFKAGLHLGSVTVAEIGQNKREIAYMGDAVNTTARIQGECNALGSNILLSEDLLEQFDSNGSFNFQDKGFFNLRGKQQAIKLYEAKINDSNKLN